MPCPWCSGLTEIGPSPYQPVDPSEIDTGDTIVYAEHGWPERKAAELAAVQRIFGHLPADRSAHFLALWQEFLSARNGLLKLVPPPEEAPPPRRFA